MSIYRAGYAEVYDLVMRHRGRDHRAEADALARLVRHRNPTAASLLDVACGTGLHLAHLRAHFAPVTGVDLSAEMLARAATRVPGATLHHGDMRDLDLAAVFDAVVCLFAVPHLRDTVELDRTVARLAAHLSPHGVLAVEPWYPPEAFVPGYVARDMVQEQGRVVIRLSHSRWLDDAHDRIRMTVHQAYADPQTGIRQDTATTELTLFRPADFAAAFGRAGLAAAHVEAEPFRWGLWLARPAGAS
ncbi:class I SAM-dependent methyltransferase [Verrucosispora sp. WMMD573]|uniref:class I SAM-dependent DNA methyltransferase n=1 Tax=Verrucosispora sp. WMMD573 TaxID=3015149 RepID=UPI00248B0709|nr:class I SAM-dependent methyltransferase [Verrucosispora sp. WMMD573]WBB53783.1 class I SAM-dependent methyltransferase [Verrucosispora sp. WMMD573]